MDVAKITELAKQAGIDTELFDGWDGHALALYPIRGGSSASLQVAQRQARENAARQNWVLDLGHRAVSLPREQGEAFKRKLDDEGIEVETSSLAVDYMKRAHNASARHDDVLSELAKR